MVSSRRFGPPRKQKFLKGYHVVVRPRGNPVVGQRNALKMAIWPNLVDATAYCINLADMYYEWGYGISDATIEPFEGMVDY